MFGCVFFVFFYCRTSNKGDILQDLQLHMSLSRQRGSDFHLRTLLNEAHSDKTHSLLTDLVMMIKVSLFILNYVEFKDIFMMIYASF